MAIHEGDVFLSIFIALMRLQYFLLSIFFSFAVTTTLFQRKVLLFGLVVVVDNNEHRNIRIISDWCSFTTISHFSSFET